MDLTSKQEGFAQAIFLGATQADAYRACYSTENMQLATIHEAASRLAADSKVAARLQELREPASLKVLITREEMVKRFLDIAELNEKDRIPALREAARLQGFYRDDQNRDQKPLQVTQVTVILDHGSQGRTVQSEERLPPTEFVEGVGEVLEDGEK